MKCEYRIIYKERYGAYWVEVKLPLHAHFDSELPGCTATYWGARFKIWRHRRRVEPEYHEVVVWSSEQQQGGAK